MPTYKIEDETWVWTKKRELAAQLMAEDVLTNDEIAAKCNLSNRFTLARWKRHPEFKKRMAEHMASYLEEIRTRGLGRIDKRIKAAEQDHQRMEEAIQARAKSQMEEYEKLRAMAVAKGEDPDKVPKVPGAETGLVVRTFRLVGEKVMSEYTIDTATPGAKVQLSKYISQEIGDLVEKHETTGGGVAIQIVLSPTDARI